MTGDQAERIEALEAEVELLRARIEAVLRIMEQATPPRPPARHLRVAGK